MATNRAASHLLEGIRHELSNLMRVEVDTKRLLPTTLAIVISAVCSTCGAQTVLPIRANDLIFDAARGVVLVSVATNSPTHANRLLSLHPRTGTLIDFVQFSEEPTVLALSPSNNILLVNLKATGEVRRLNPSTLDQVGSFVIGNYGGEVHTADRIRFAPGSETRIALGHSSTVFPGSNDAVAIYDNWSKLPNEFAGEDLVFDFGASQNTLYGQGSGDRFHTLPINANGLQNLNNWRNRVLDSGAHFTISEGLAYVSSGRVLDYQAFDLKGKYTSLRPQGSNSSPFVVDVPNGVVSISQTNSTPLTILFHDKAQFRQIESLQLPTSNNAWRMVRSGHSGIALATEGNELFLVETSSTWSANPIRPQSLTVVRGVVKQGGLPAVQQSDDDYLAVDPGVVFSSSQSPVEIVVQGTAPRTSPQALSLRLEGRGSSTNLSQRIELFDFVANTFEAVDNRAMTTSDSEVKVEVFANAARFVHPLTSQVRAKFTFKATGPVFSYPWHIFVDHAYWVFSQ